MEVTTGAEEGFIREWTPCSHILNLIPLRVQTGIFSTELYLTCVDAVSEYIALGTNIGLVYWYDRKKGNIQKLKCEASNSPITFVKIVSTVDYMVGAGNAAGQVTVFQIPKEHPENIPDNFKPKVEPKVERYTIGDLHKSKITAIEWSKNGMRLFSGDEHGVIIMTEIDFYMHLCKSSEIVNEGHEIVQLSYYQNSLLVSSLYRTIICERRDGGWKVNQLGKRERKSLSRLGAVWQYSYCEGGEPRIYCARPGLRIWRADKQGNVLQTLLFKEAISNPLTVAEVLNPCREAAVGVGGVEAVEELGTLHVFRSQLVVGAGRRALAVLDPRSLQAAALVLHLRRILSVSVNKDEIFVLEGPRSLVRLAHAPEPAALAPEDPSGTMSKSLTWSLASAVSSVRDLGELTGALLGAGGAGGEVAPAEECFELPPVARLPADMSHDVLSSIVNEFRDVCGDGRADTSDLQRKLNLYNTIMERKVDEELIHSSRRNRRRDPPSGAATPRRHTPVRKLDAAPLHTGPYLMNVSVHSDASQENDELLEKEIEEKEKILAKMLNLESLSISSATPATQDGRADTPPLYRVDIAPSVDNKPVVKPNKNADPKPKDSVDLVPRVMKLPNNWNLENIKLDLKPKLKDRVLSPDEHLDSEWEII